MARRTTSLSPVSRCCATGSSCPSSIASGASTLEARGLIKGAPVIYLGRGSKDGFSRLHVLGAENPRLSAASIVKIEKPGEEEPFIPFAARMGATFLHWRGGHDPQGAGFAMARGAGLRPRPLCRRAVGPDRGRAGAVETAGLCGDHPRRGAADLGDALHAVETAGAARDRGPEGAGRAAETGRAGGKANEKPPSSRARAPVSGAPSQSACWPAAGMWA